MTKSAKTRQNKKRGRRGRKDGLGMPHSLNQPHYVVTLPYGTTTQLVEAAAGAGASWSYSLNNAFDPDFTGVGLQPVGYDQFSQFYGRYRVIGVRWEVSMTNITANSAWSGVYPANSSVLPATPGAWAVQPPKPSAFPLSVSGGGTDSHVFRGSYPIHLIFGVTKKQYLDEADFAALVTAGPARTSYLHCWIIGNGPAAATVRVMVRLWYQIEFSQPVALSLS